VKVNKVLIPLLFISLIQNLYASEINRQSINNLYLIPKVNSAQQTWRADLLKYINGKLLKPDGGYGWEDQPDSHSTVTFAVTGILADINALPQDKARLAEFIRTHHPQKGPNKEAGPSGADMRNLVYEQIQAILWLSGDVSSFKEDVAGWQSQGGKLANYEGHKYPGMFQDAMIPICQKLVNVPLSNPSAFITYFQTHRRENGSFNNSPTSAGGDGNILNTYWSLSALNALNSLQTNAITIKWLQDCQLKNGGFTHAPNPQIGVNDDVVYTWAGIRALQMLGAQPKNVQGAINYLVSLHNADGGFGDRPGLHSTPVATYYAIGALKMLNGFGALDKAAAPKSIAEVNPDFSGYHIYTVQFQAQGNGSPQEAVMLADSLKIQLWGAKYPAAGWVAAAQKIADEEKVPVTFFIADEPHDNEVIIPGMGAFNHILDYISPASIPVHFKDSCTFDDFKNTTLQQLKTANGGLILQVSNNEPLARMLLDESVNTKLGYLAISSVHFGQNFAFWLPYLNEYRYRLPVVTLQDAHGTESWWWADELTDHRNLFIAKESTYEALTTALKNNWIVGIRHDSLSNFKTRMLGGTDAARKFINDKERDWKWWDAPNRVNRPQAAITVINNKDAFEAGKPQDEGINIRVRCRWHSVREALKSAAVTLQELKVDGKTVKADEVIKRGKNGPVDAYYLYKWGNPDKGTHQIEAVIKDLATNIIKTYKQTYTQK
jgi:prenyltransferase beta subunit